MLALNLGPLGLAAEDVAIYRTFAHKFNWTPETVDEREVRLLAAFMHDFEVERIKMTQARDGDKDKGANIKGQIVKFDDRVPLSVKAMPIHVAEAWINRWNKAHPDKPKIPRPEVIYEMAGQVPGMPQSE